MSGEFDVGIIGGGVIGLSCAWRLAQSGARVALFERGEIGHEASWAAAGMLAAQCEAAHHPPSEDESSTRSRAAMFDLCLQGRAMYGDFADELFDATGIDIELSLKGHKRNDWRTPGILYVQTRDDDMAIKNFALQKECGSIIRNASFPNASLGNTRAAIWLEDEGQVNNRSLIVALKKAVEKIGVKIYENRAVQIYDSPKPRTNPTGKRWRRVTHINRKSDFIACSQTLVCAGRGSSSQSWWLRAPIVPVGGEMIELGTGSDKMFDRVVYSSDVYLVPRRNGKLLIGATVKKNRSSLRVTMDGMLRLLSAAHAIFPQLSDYEITDSWTGVRPGTPDGLPILGSTPIENLHIATGHYRNGILLAPITAKLMTDCILNGVEPPREFSIKRFQNQEVVA